MLACPRVAADFKAPGHLLTSPCRVAFVQPALPPPCVLLLMSGERDHTAPPALVNASYKQQDNPGVTEIEKIPGHGHALIIDSGWRETADKALAFVQRFI
jgi:non-heme chloroperoxidase